jgi:raffinose/stachyose/melibiose transport system substrate-binding protein
MKHLRSKLLLTMLMVFAFVLSACQAAVPAAQPAPDTSGQEAAAEPSPATESSAEPQEEITLRVWDPFVENGEKVVLDLYDKFMAQHPNIKIVREVVPLEQARATTKTALASGTGPDLIYHDVTPERELYQAGLVVGLNDYADQYGWRDRFYPSGLRWTETAEGDLYALGLEYEFVGVFYNKTLMDEAGLTPPSTIEETVAFCKAAREKGYIPFAFGQNPGWQAYFSFTMPVHNQVGVDTMEKLLFEGEGSWNTEDMAKAVDVFYKTLKDAECFAEDVNGIDWDQMNEMMYNGEALMIPTGTWIVNNLLTNASQYEFEMMPFPAIEGGSGGRVYTAGMGSAWAISANSAHPEAAAMLVDFIFSDEAVKAWLEQASVIPPVKADTTGMDLPPLFKFVVDTLRSAGEGTGEYDLGYDVDLIVPEEFNTILRDGFQAVWAGSKTTQQQLDDLQQAWENR